MWIRSAYAIWYLQFHFVCDKVFKSFILDDLPLLLLQLADRNFSIAKGVFIPTVSP